MKTKIMKKAITVFLSAAFIATSLAPTSVFAADKIAMTSVTVGGDFGNRVYNGQDQHFSPSVTYNGVPLSKGADYTETWSDDTTNAGTVKLTLEAVNTSGNEKYTGKVEKSFTISQAQPVISQTDTNRTDVTVAYTGSGICFPYTVKTEQEGDVTTKLAGCTTVSYTKRGSSTPLAADALPTDPGTYDVKINVKPSTSTTALIKQDYKDAAQFNGTLNISYKQISSVLLDGATNGKLDLPWTGAKIEPTLMVYDSNGDLVPSTEYDISYPNAVNKGSYTVTVKAKSTSKLYAGSASAGFNIVDTTSDNGIVFADSDILIGTNDTIDDQNYTGSQIKPTPKVSYQYTEGGALKTEELKLNRDYSLTYGTNVEVGSNAGSITFTGMGKFRTTSFTKNFNIVAKELTGSMVTLSPTSYEYTRSPIDARITVKNGNRTLTKGTDYNVTYPEGNTNVGGYVKVDVTGIKVGGNPQYYTGTVEKTFAITKHPISASEFTLSQDVFTVSNTGNTSLAPVKPVVSYTQSNSRYYDDDISDDTVNFTLTYANNTAAGNASVTITGKGNYSGSVTKTFKITTTNPNAHSLTSNTSIDDIKAVNYTGSAQTPSVVVKYNGVALRNGTDYQLSYQNNTNAGTASVIVTGINNYKDSITKTFTINAIPISSTSIASIPDQEYTGAPITPDVTISFGGRTLVKDRDYRVTYAANTAIGTAKVTINGIGGNFNGYVEKTFRIVERLRKVNATGISLNDSYDLPIGSTLTLVPNFTPSNANQYQIKWTSSNEAFTFANGLSTSTVSNEGAVISTTGNSGSTIITATLLDPVSGVTLGTASTMVKIAKQFSDVPQDYYTNAVNTLANYGYTTGSGSTREWHATPVINGTSSTTFTPSGDVTRAQFVMMLYNKAVADYKAGKTSTDPSKASASNFSDVNSYTEAINWAVANGITFGKGNNTFDPNGTVTRAEAVAFLQRYMKGGNANTTKFTDVKNDAYYAGAVGWAVANGITAGTSNTTFSPQQKCNRAQAATFIYRAVF